MEKSYSCEVFNARFGFFLVFFILILLSALSMYIGVKLKDPLICVIGFVFVLLSPLIFNKKMRDFFTMGSLLEFSDNFFSVSILSLKNGNLLNKSSFEWRNIKTYSVYFSPAKNTILTIYCKDGKTRRWNFKDDKTLDEALNEESLFKHFFMFANKYNENKEYSDQIGLSPGFLATQKGTVILYVIILLMISAFIVHLLYNPQTSILSLLVGVSILIQLVVKRNKEKSLLAKISNYYG